MPVVLVFFLLGDWSSLEQICFMHFRQHFNCCIRIVNALRLLKNSRFEVSEGFFDFLALHSTKQADLKICHLVFLLFLSQHYCTAVSETLKSLKAMELEPAV